MKYKLLALLIFTFVKTASAQSRDETAKNGLPKGARIISVTSSEDKSKLYEQVGRAFFENGFEIKSKDESLGIIQSKHKKSRGGWWIQVIASVEDKNVKIRGMAAGQRYGGTEIENSGPNKYIFGFEEMDKVAKSIPNAKIEYIK